MSGHCGRGHRVLLEPVGADWAETDRRRMYYDELLDRFGAGKYVRVFTGHTKWEYGVFFEEVRPLPDGMRAELAERLERARRERAREDLARR